MGLVQERRNSIANALELRLSCTNSSIWPSPLPESVSILQQLWTWTKAVPHSLYMLLYYTGLTALYIVAGN